MGVLEDVLGQLPGAETPKPGIKADKPAAAKPAAKAADQKPADQSDDEHPSGDAAGDPPAGETPARGRKNSMTYHDKFREKYGERA